MQTKSCTNPKCEQVNPQPVTEFYLNRGRPKDRYNSHCKSCFRRYYEDNQEKLRLQRTERYRIHKEKNKERLKVNKEKTPRNIKEYYQDNREKIIEQSLNNYRANLEQRKEGQRRWQKENREYLSMRRRERRRENPEVMYAQRHRRRARKLGNGGSYTAEEWQALCAFYDYRCLCCKEQKPLTVDHVIPISKGGSSDISNLQPLCRSCNSSKHDNTIDYRSNFTG